MSRERNRIQLLQRAMDVVFGDERGRHDEQGWARGSWTADGDYDPKTRRHAVTVCLNSALKVAERDLFGVGHGVVDSDDVEAIRLRTTEAQDAQALLAETIREMYPEHFREYPPPNNELTIVKFNDEIAGGGRHNDPEEAARDMETVLRKCEDKAFAKWLLDDPLQVRSDVSQAFIDYAVEGGVS